jgi:hypothetical protein
VCALKGEYEEAIDNYPQAIALDDTYHRAMLNAQRCTSIRSERFDEALSMCSIRPGSGWYDGRRSGRLPWLLKFDASAWG